MRVHLVMLFVKLVHSRSIHTTVRYVNSDDRYEGRNQLCSFNMYLEESTTKVTVCYVALSKQRGTLGICGVAVLRIFSCGVAVKKISACGVSVISSLMVRDVCIFKVYGVR